MSPFKNIIVLIDCSKADLPVMELIREFINESKTEITLCHVIHSHTLDQDRVLKEKANSYLDKLIYEINEEYDNKVNKLLLSGEPEVTLEKEINNGPYDLVALGTHGHKGFQDVLYGSVSKYLKHRVSIPIIMVKGKE